MDQSQTPLESPRGSRNALARNLTALYAIRLGTSLLPLVSIPYVVRVLGPAGYGIYAFAGGLIGYFNMLIDYGFNLAATRRIAASRHDAVARDRVVSATLAAKLPLALLGFLVLLALTWLLPPLRESRLVALFLYGQVLGNALFPLWLYQGEERMVGSSILLLTGMLTATGAIFLVVNDPGDYVALAALWGGVSVATGAIALLAALVLFRVRLRAPSFDEVRRTLRDGVLLTITSASTTLYTSGNAFLLGLVAPKEVVGLYGAGEKIVRAVQELVNPIQQALYPRTAAIAGRSHALAVDAARRLIRWTAGLGLLLSLGILITAPLAVRIVLGEDFVRSVAVVRLLSPLPFLVAVSSTLTFQLMLPLGRDRALLRTITAAGIANVGLALLLAPRFLERGMALAVLSTELLVVAVIAIYLERTGVHRLVDPVPGVAAAPAAGVTADER